MKKYMYFASGDGADDGNELLIVEGNRLVAVEPKTANRTVVFFEKDNDQKDKVIITHDDTTDTTGHRCRDISKALAEAANAGPHVDGMTTIADMDTNTFYPGLGFITGLVIKTKVGISF